MGVYPPRAVGFLDHRFDGPPHDADYNSILRPANKLFTIRLLNNYGSDLATSVLKFIHQSLLTVELANPNSRSEQVCHAIMLIYKTVEESLHAQEVGPVLRYMLAP